MKIIKSKDNPSYKLAMKLTKRKFRDSTGLYLLEGIKPLEDAINEGISIEQIYVAEGSDTHGLPDDKVCILDKKLFEAISDTATSQGIVAVVRQQSSDEHKLDELISSDDPIIILDRIQDPGNMGTIIRTAEAAGFAGVILVSGCVDPYGSKVVRATAGSLLRVPIVSKVDTDVLINHIKFSHRVLAVTALEDAVSYSQIPKDGKVAIVIGNEGQGVSDKFVESADLKIKIPMAGAIESLNAAVAAGILMYESQKK